MALFALYRLMAEEGRLLVDFSDIRAKGHSIRHQCSLPNDPVLIRELTDQLEKLGFPFEFDRKMEENPAEVRFFAVHRIADGAGTAAAAIEKVAASRGIKVTIVTQKGAVLPFHEDPPQDEPSRKRRITH